MRGWSDSERRSLEVDWELADELDGVLMIIASGSSTEKGIN